MAVEEVAPGVHRLPLGRGLTETNVYLVESGASWTLVDTGWPQHAREVLAAAKGLFGTRAAPSGIVLTHLHPDHSGAAPELVRRWDVPVYLHPDEVPFARGGYDYRDSTGPAGPVVVDNGLGQVDQVFGDVDLPIRRRRIHEDQIQIKVQEGGDRGEDL